LQNAITIEKEEPMGRFVSSMKVYLDLRVEQVPGDDGAGAVRDAGEARPC
jgi:hypothetical protein